MRLDDWVHGSNYAEIWGNVPEWLSAIGTVGAFAGTVAILRRDRRDRRRALADNVAVWAINLIFNEKPFVKVHVHNANLAAVPRLSVKTTKNSADQLKYMYKSDEMIATINEAGAVLKDLNTTIEPGESLSYSFALKKPVLESLLYVHFEDARGQIWYKNVLTGEYMSRKRLGRLSKLSSGQIYKHNKRHLKAPGSFEP